MAVENDEIADVLDRIADYLEIEDANTFRIFAHRRAAESIRVHDVPLAEMLASGDDLTELPDVGKGIAEKVAELVSMGRDAFVETLDRRASPGLLDLLRIPGLGPKRVRALRDELGVTCLDDLKRVAKEGRLRDASGFGEKREQEVLRRLERLEGQEQGSE